MMAKFAHPAPVVPNGPRRIAHTALAVPNGSRRVDRRDARAPGTGRIERLAAVKRGGTLEALGSDPPFPSRSEAPCFCVTELPSSYL